MKRTTFMRAITCAALLAAAVLSIASSCTKNETAGQAAPADGEVRINFSAEPLATKAQVDATSAESAIHSIDLFVFQLTPDAIELLEVYVHKDFTSPVTSHNEVIKTTSGTKYLFAFANLDPSTLASLTTRDACQDRVRTFIHNNRGSFVMGVETMVDLNYVLTESTEPQQTIDLVLKRDAARVTVKKIENAILPATRDIRLTGVYLNNVPRSFTPGSNVGYYSNPEALWRTTDFDDDTPANIVSLLSQGETPSAMALPYSFPGGAAWECPAYHVYGQINRSVEKAPGMPDTITKLVIELTETVPSGDDVVYYYPIAILNMSPNCTYEVENVTITRTGSLDPDTYLPNTISQASIRADKWDGTQIVGSYNYSFDSEDGVATF